MEKFSFIVPIHNVEPYLPACVDSLLAQTYPCFEIILVDDVSTDSSRQIAESYEKRFPDKVKLLVHQVNTRQGGARNTGIDAATGDYLLFIDSDDYIRPNTLQCLHAALRQSGADIVEFCYDFVDEKGNYLRRSSFQSQIRTLGGTDKPLLISTMGPCNRVYRSKLFDNPKLRFAEKYYYEDYWLIPTVLLAANQVHYLEDSLYCYRQRAGSTIHDANVQRNLDILVCTDHLLEVFREMQASDAQMLQLEYLAIEHVLLHATLRVNSGDRRSPIQQQLKQYIEENFPHYKKNPYRKLLSARYQKLLRYIEKGQYLRLYLAWACRNRLTGRLKAIARKIRHK